jgi:dTDP-4-dehydrorhamnose 3,5-epimerase
MNPTQSALPGVVIVDPKVFTDERGYFLETFSAEKYKALGIDLPFVQDNESQSVQGTLRGLHYQLQHPQGKLVRVSGGEVFDVAVDIRQGSPTFGHWQGVYLSAANKRQFYVPPGFAHGFYVLSDTAVFVYKCTDYYSPEDEYGLLWNDPDVAIDWPILAGTTPMLSSKDAVLPGLKDAEAHLPHY